MPRVIYFEEGAPEQFTRPYTLAVARYDRYGRAKIMTELSAAFVLTVLGLTLTYFREDMPNNANKALNLVIAAVPPLVASLNRFYSNGRKRYQQLMMNGKNIGFHHHFLYQTHTKKKDTSNETGSSEYAISSGSRSLSNSELSEQAGSYTSSFSDQGEEFSLDYFKPYVEKLGLDIDEDKFKEGYDKVSDLVEKAKATKKSQSRRNQIKSVGGLLISLLSMTSFIFVSIDTSDYDDVLKGLDITSALIPVAIAAGFFIRRVLIACGSECCGKSDLTVEEEFKALKREAIASGVLKSRVVESSNSDQAAYISPTPIFSMGS